jgi:hypothetical protein
MDEKRGERLRGAVDFSFGIKPIIELIALPIAAGCVQLIRSRRDLLSTLR